MSMMKCAGQGHSNGGVGRTAQGELVLVCWACLQPGKNLPDGWECINWAEMPEDLLCVIFLSIQARRTNTQFFDRYKYFIFLAEDANFRPINQHVSSEAHNQIIDDRLGYFCNRELYKKFLCTHVDEEEISTCSGFQAMFLANVKRVKGLRMTGMGGVTCAHHNMWCPNGIGDLQRSERYVRDMMNAHRTNGITVTVTWISFYSHQFSIQFYSTSSFHTTSRASSARTSGRA